MLAEWNFFATSHSKTACDGIGTLIASLQHSVSNQIITPCDMLKDCSVNISGIQFYFVSKEAVLEAEAPPRGAFQHESYHSVKGTQRYHCYIPQSTSTLAVHEISSGERTCCGQCRGITAGCDQGQLHHMHV